MTDAKPTMADIVKAAAQHYRVPVREVMGARQDRKFSHPRQIAMVLCRAHTNHSLPRIARHFGRDHTTILHAMRGIGARHAADRAAILALAQGIAAARAARERDWVTRLHQGEVSWAEAAP